MPAAVMLRCPRSLIHPCMHACYHGWGMVSTHVLRGRGRRARRRGRRCCHVRSLLPRGGGLCVSWCCGRSVTADGAGASRIIIRRSACPRGCRHACSHCSPQANDMEQLQTAYTPHPDACIQANLLLKHMHCHCYFVVVVRRASGGNSHEMGNRDAGSKDGTHDGTARYSVTLPGSVVA